MVEKSKRVISVPENVEVSISGNILKVSGPLGVLEREFLYPRVRLTVSKEEIEVSTNSSHKKYVAMVGTYAAHIRNMLKGVTEGFRYELKAVFSHFPIQLSVDKDKLVIANFLGERHPRYATIMDGVKVEVSDNHVIVKGINKEAVGQTATNIEQVTRIKRFDARVFQDGIYLVSRGE
ncbi:MAG: 50S ribosomal protein L6 [Methermicoccaceae archaeon]